MLALSNAGRPPFGVAGGAATLTWATGSAGGGFDWATGVAGGGSDWASAVEGGGSNSAAVVETGGFNWAAVVADDGLELEGATAVETDVTGLAEGSALLGGYPKATIKVYEYGEIKSMLVRTTSVQRFHIFRSCRSSINAAKLGSTLTLLSSFTPG